MGIAIMSGIMHTLDDLARGQTPYLHSPAATSIPATPLENQPQSLPTRFIACVRRPQSAARIKKAVATFNTPCAVYINENVRAVSEADVVLLGCKPQMFREIVAQEGIRAALEGKLVISILAGVTAEQLVSAIYSEDDTTELSRRCRVVRAMPNTASLVRESMTVIAHAVPPLPEQDSLLVTWMFSRIGRVVHLPASAMDASTALCGSGPAFMALVLEALSDGGVAMGLPRQESQLMAAQVMMGTAELVMSGGEHPAILRDKVSTPGGCTIGGLLVLEEGRVRGSVARAVREAAVVASQLGQGVVGVNGTRHLEHRRMGD